MDLDDFKASIAESTALLIALQRLLPKRVDAELIAYLQAVQTDRAGLELLRNAISPAK